MIRRARCPDGAPFQWVGLIGWGGLALVLIAGCGGGGHGSDPDAGPVCGNGHVDPGEACDGADLGGISCADFGWHMGEIACADDCTLDVSGCVGGGPQCGNGVREYGEACDASDLGDATCQTAGFGAGTLGCRSDCTFALVACGAPATCGNGARDGAEECDGADLGGATCQSMGFPLGELGCASNCTLDTGRCVDSICGNAIQEAEEECDASDLAGYDCVMLGHDGGTLGCTSRCLFDESHCQ